MTKKTIFHGIRPTDDGFQSIAAAVLCAIIGIIAGFVILLLINAEHAPQAIATILKNFFYYKKASMQSYYFGNTLVQAVPLILCGISVLFAYKAGLFNIGAAGQYCIAIAFSLWSSLGWRLPWWMSVVIAILVAAAWGAIAGVLNAFFNINVVIACIMLNWISLYLANIMLQHESVMDLTLSESHKLRVIATREGASQILLPNCGLDKLFNKNIYVTIAVPLTILVVIAVMIVLDKTIFGYELKATGINKHAAKYAGMQDKRNIILTMTISGGLAGLAAALYYLTGFEQWHTVSAVPAMGFNGIAVAFLGGLHPIGVMIAGYFIQHITIGGSLIDMRYYNPQIADLISSIIIYACAFVLFFKTKIGEFFEKRTKNLENVNDE